MEEEKEEKIGTQIKEEIEQQIAEVVKKGIQGSNLDTLGKLIDIHKDLANEEYWNKKKEVMDMRYRDEGSYGNYGNYGNYGRRGRDSRGRYSEGTMGGEHPEEMINEIRRSYQMYSRGREQYGRGNYGAKEDTMKSLEYMLVSMVDFVEMLKEEAGSEEEMELIRHYTKKISEM